MSQDVDRVWTGTASGRVQQDLNTLLKGTHGDNLEGELPFPPQGASIQLTD